MRKQLDERIRLSALIIALGLIVQGVSATVLHPLAFIAYLLVGFPLVCAGVLYFLSGLVSKAGRNDPTGDLATPSHVPFVK